MKNNYRSILYPFLFLIIISGFGLFLFRHQLLIFLRAQENPVMPVIPNRTAATSTEATADILKSPRFTALINNVINFDFDNICYRPAEKSVVNQTIPTDIEAAADNATTTEEAAPLPLNCVRGNSLPFSKK